jgi:hypothetical protein
MAAALFSVALRKRNILSVNSFSLLIKVDWEMVMFNGNDDEATSHAFS